MMNGQMTLEQAREATIRALAPQSFDSSAIAQETIDSGASIEQARERFRKEIAKRQIERISPQSFGGAMGFEPAGMDARPGTPNPDSLVERMSNDDFKASIGV